MSETDFDPNAYDVTTTRTKQTDLQLVDTETTGTGGVVLIYEPAEEKETKRSSNPTRRD